MHFHSIFSLLKKEISKIRMPHKQKVFIGALVVLSSVLSLNAHPMYDGPSPAVLLKDMPRTQRQVVQPTWLVDKRRPATPSEANVRITAQNLQEAAELREEIRKAVEEGRFAVDVEQDSSTFIEEGNFQSQSVPQPLGPFSSNQPQWSFPWIPMEQFRSQQPQSNIMQRMWNDFMENTRRVWERN
ncbi:uncharacterized protein LOC101454797 isoform X1 [Ceratitis capitata]|uniref:uncharacterized protein LOC101454797 isoform X1 n=1 Tax=Ceratitis capitata TaxID=7213 RepID=UPI00032A2A13|nr:uncharacterized protein LOC101454797 isoform X1 [Ceratitis capitata]